MREYRLSLSLGLAGALAGFLACGLNGCASAPHGGSGLPKDDIEAMRLQMTEMHALIVNQGMRLDSFETRIGTLNDKLTSNQSSFDRLVGNHKAAPTAIAAHPSTGAGTESPEPMASDDPEAGFVTDRAIQDYRKGEILLEAQKYPEAVLAFTSFVEKYPDHPLAGSAQYSIGEAYFKRKEYKLARHEFERVLTSYDRSPHISDTLHDLADAEDALKMPEQAARHRQLLTSLFAQAPATSFIASSSKNADESSPSSNAHGTPPRLDEPPTSEEHAPPRSAPLTAPLSNEVPAAE